MYATLFNLDWNRMMRQLKVEEIHPVVRLANHHPVAAGEFWDRSIPDLQLIAILSGRYEFAERDQRPIQLGPGDILFIEPNTHHRFNLTANQVEGWIAGFHFELIPDSRWAAGDYRLVIEPDRVTHLDNGAYLLGRFQQMALVYESYRPYRRELVDSIAAEVLFILAAQWQTGSLWAANPSQRMQAMLVYIRQNLCLPLSRRSLASQFNLSPGYINEVFQAELGMSPSAVINRERLTRAYQLIIRDGLSVTESALAVGFRDPFYFSRLFKQIYQFPPSEIATRKRRRS